jgi:hypothetical protein
MPNTPAVNYVHRVTVAALVVPFIGCGSSSKPADSVTSPAAEHAVSGGQAYDAGGKARDCATPRNDCAGGSAVNRDFLDQCSLHGYRVIQCGCESLCTGDVSSAKHQYDASGHVKDCAPADASCNATPAPAAFQDACAEKGFKMSQCGCEWLCSGDVTKAR